MSQAVVQFCPKVCGRSYLTGLGNLLSVQARWTANAWFVSSHGRVRDSRGRIGHGSPAGGYKRVTIEGKRYLVHRLVAAAFIGPTTAEKWQVNHIDRDRANNHIANLEFVSNAENARHSFINNLSRKRIETRQGKAVEWRHRGESTWSFSFSQAEAARKLKVSEASISYCLGKHARAFGRSIGYEIRRASLEPDVQACEEWKPALLPGSTLPIPDLMVSSHGRIWSKSCRHSYVTHGSLTCEGYHRVSKHGQKHFVHSLVAAAFLGHPQSPDMVVNHVDSDGANNHVQNLEYVTRSQNLRHAYSQGREPKGPAKPVQARWRSPQGPWLDFESIRAASLNTGLCRGKISRLCQAQSLSGASWEFQFKDAEDLEGEEWRSVDSAVLKGARAPMK